MEQVERPLTPDWAYYGLSPENRARLEAANRNAQEFFVLVDGRIESVSMCLAGMSVGGLR